MKYKILSDFFEKLSNNSKRTYKTYYTSELLKQLKTEETNEVILLLQGKIFPAYVDKKIGISSRLIIKAISISSGLSINKIEQNWKKMGDLGEVAEKVLKNKKQMTLSSKALRVEDIITKLRKITEIEGEGSVNTKVKIICELLSNSSPLEAKYIVRIVLEDLRIGIGEGIIRDSIAWAFAPKVKGVFFKCENCNIYLIDKKCINCRKKCEELNEDPIKIDDEEELLNKKYDPKDILETKKGEERKIYNKIIQIIQHAIDVTNDYTQVIETIKNKGLIGLNKIKLKPTIPIKVMLALKVKNIENGFKKVGTPAQLEYKLDGFRMQIHKQGEIIKIFTRRLEDVTKQFFDVVKVVREQIKGESYIIDSEAVGINPKNNEYLPFQKISQRIRRKHNINEIAKKIPIELNVFDIVYYNGESLIYKKFKERRKILNEIIKEMDNKIRIVETLVTSSIEKGEEFYAESLAKGNEGIMLKALDEPYKPGARVGFMVKLKPIMENLDLVIVKAEYGTGKRSGWFSSFTLACRDDDKFLEIGKIGTGFKEKEGEGLSFSKLTEMLKPLIVSENNKEVKVIPKIVVEVSYEEIQKSPTYNSRFALRFPRLVRLREDRRAEDCSKLEFIQMLYDEQFQL